MPPVIAHRVSTDFFTIILYILASVLAQAVHVLEQTRFCASLSLAARSSSE
jgi:hypothetical protein